MFKRKLSQGFLYAGLGVLLLESFVAEATHVASVICAVGILVRMSPAIR